MVALIKFAKQIKVVQNTNMWTITNAIQNIHAKKERNVYITLSCNEVSIEWEYDGPKDNDK